MKSIWVPDFKTYLKIQTHNKGVYLKYKNRVKYIYPRLIKSP